MRYVLRRLARRRVEDLPTIIRGIQRENGSSRCCRAVILRAHKRKSLRHRRDNRRTKPVQLRRRML